MQNILRQHTQTEDMMKFESWFRRYACGQTNKRTDTLITIRSPTRAAD